MWCVKLNRESGFMYDILIEKIDNYDIKKVEEFLSGFELSLDKDVEYTIAAIINDEIVGTCSFSGRVIKCFAVKKDLQGEGISAKLITHLTNVLFDKGIRETFIFTKPANKEIFEGLGYAEVYSSETVMLLEGGFANVKKYINSMFEKSGLKNGEKAGIVMNCNPFTIGHRYLIERAAEENKEVVIFIVEENQSVFPFEVRYNLVKSGTEDLKNVKVIPGGNYIISSNTFPSYFLKQEDEKLKAYTNLDAGIFGKYIANIFNIKRRYVGTEPFDRVTEKYNEALIEVMPKFNVEVVLIDRLFTNQGIVSASEVRKLIKENAWDELKKIVPKVTYDYLNSIAAKEILSRI
jgi:[citrate (pro-3S)-lyase] ligase